MERLNSFINIVINLLTLTLLFNCTNLASASCQGCVELDVLTFDKLLAKFQYSLIKFDIAFPYGEKHEEFGKFAKNYATKLVKFNSELLIGLVGIKDYGEKDNSELGDKYSVDKEKYPAIFIFKNTTLHSKWPEHLDINYKNIKQFVQDNTDLYIGCDGCIEIYDELVEDFMTSDTLGHKVLVLETVMYRSKDDKGNSEIYFKFMRKVFADGNKFILEETNRLKKLLHTKISSAKIEEIKIKLNILKIFEKNIPKEDKLKENSKEGKAELKEDSKENPKKDNQLKEESEEENKEESKEEIKEELKEEL